MLYLTDRPASDHQIGFAAHDGSNQLPDVVGAVLIVRIGIDDDIGPGLEARFNTGAKRVCQPLVPGQTYNMVNAVPYRDFYSAIGASVIDDQPLERINSGKRTGEFAERDTERCFFIENTEFV